MLPSTFHPVALRKGRFGFSLVEVTIAMGIVSFALITLLGIVPIGLMAAQDAMRQTANAHIIQQISGDLGRMSIGDLPGYIATPQYYDFDGQRLENAADATFVTTLAKSAPSYPGSSQLDGLSDNFERVSITIRRPTEGTNTAFRTTLSIFNSGSNPGS